MQVRDRVDLDRLVFRILKPSRDRRGGSGYLDAAYDLWASVWRQTLAELDRHRRVTSDDFTRQDELLTIWSGAECVASVSMRWMDFRCAYSRDDSYFLIWPDEARLAVVQDGPLVCVPSYLTVAKPWRGAIGASLKHVLCGIVTARFLASRADVIVGITRNDKGMDEVCRNNGYVTLMANLTHHNVPVNLVAFFRKRCTRPPAAESVEVLIQRFIRQTVSTEAICEISSTPK